MSEEKPLGATGTSEVADTHPQSHSHEPQQKQQQQTHEAPPMSPLERFASAASRVYAPQSGIEPLASGGMAMMSERKHQYIFKRLARPMPLPSKYHYWAMVGTLFLVMFLAGWNDGSQGPLLPSLQAYYHVDYLVISIIWVFNALGFFLSGVANVWLADRLGFGLLAPLGSCCQMIGYVLMCWGGPYPLFCFAFVLNGFGLGIQDAQVNSLVSRMKGASTLMFLMHAVYGLGATVSPLVSTQFVKHVQSKVYYYYAVSLGLAFTTAVLLLLVFQMRTDDQVVGYRDEEKTVVEGGAEATESGAGEAGTSKALDTVNTGTSEKTAALPTSPEDEAAAAKAARKAATAHQSGSKMKRIVRSPAVYMLSIYILIYVGVEVTIGGWATSFLVDERGGNNSSGYVSSGFFGGLTIGRVILIPVTAWLGGWNAVWVYTAIAIALEVVVWTVHSIIGNAIAFAFCGIALGPMYPIVMMVVVDTIPAELQSGSIGIIASIGQVGSAILPFITGGIAQSRGVWILQPLMVALMGLSLIVWFFVPRKPVKA